MRRLLPVFALMLALFFAATAAGQDPEAEKAHVDQRIAELQAEISAAKEQEGVLTSQLGAVVTELQAAQSAVEQAEGSLRLLEAQLASEQGRLERLTDSPGDADAAAAATPEGVPARGRDLGGASPRDLHRGGAGCALGARLGDDVRRPDRRLRVRESDRAAGSAHRRSGGDRQAAGSGRASRDRAHAAPDSGHGLGDRIQNGRGA